MLESDYILFRADANWEWKKYKPRKSLNRMWMDRDVHVRFFGVCDWWPIAFSLPYGKVFASLHYFGTPSAQASESLSSMIACNWFAQVMLLGPDPEKKRLYSTTLGFTVQLSWVNENKIVLLENSSGKGKFRDGGVALADCFIDFLK